MSLTLVLGGARSGKSRFAQSLVAAREDVVYLATAEISDSEMAARIARHRADRPGAWRTVEAPRQAAAAIRAAAGVQVVLLDCLTVLLANRLGEMRLSEPIATESEVVAASQRVQAELDDLLALAAPPDLVVVANEVGLGVVPASPSGRLFRDLAGLANQRMAAAAAEVWFVAAGLPLRLK